MKLKKIHICSFRNIKEMDITPATGVTVVFGNNAQGKTNLLEAICLLGTMKSFRLAKNGDLIRWGTEHALIRGWVEKNRVVREIALNIDRGGKRVRVDQKSPTRLSDFFGHLNVVVFSPEEMSMTRGEPEIRRRFLDRAIFSSDLGYLSVYHEYHRTLKQRNNLLRSGERSSLAIWTERLVQVGERLILHRKNFISEMAPLVARYYRQIAGSGEEADIGYRVHGVGSDGQATLAAALAKSTDEELRRGVTLVGPHRDDLSFNIDGRMVKGHASQGQQRSYVLALKMAEIDLLQERHGDPPILLLDDISSELDQQRNHNLMEFLKLRDIQVFLTTTDPGNLAPWETGQYASFRIEEGTIVQ